MELFGNYTILEMAGIIGVSGTVGGLLTGAAIWAIYRFMPD